MKKKLFAVGIAISSCLIPLEVRAASFTGLNVFGDSLADSGNLFNFTDAILSPLGLPPLPPPPYAQRNSNGPIWIDNVGQALGLTPTLATEFVVNPLTTPPPNQGVNFAFAGALSSDVHVLDDDFPFLADFFPGFQDQIDAFTTLSATVPVDSSALNVIWIGGNDYNEAFFNPASLGGLSLAQLPNFVTDNIIDGLTQLDNLGAQEFLVVNLPDTGAAPFADFLDAQSPLDIPAILNQLTSAHNELLSVKLDAFAQSRPDTNITTLDVGTLFADILANPGAFGFTNVTDSCLSNFQPGFLFDGVCSNPDEFFFWDDTHPTTAAYKVVSDFALAALGHGNATPASVPEPNSLAALLALGMVGFGAVLTKRAR
ncbi:MAG: SGNH/GDSL hydrolase family protein [Cyanobacteria bacterium P01_B01_bin.77]